MFTPVAQIGDNFSTQYVGGTVKDDEVKEILNKWRQITHRQLVNSEMRRYAAIAEKPVLQPLMDRVARDPMKYYQELDCVVEKFGYTLKEAILFVVDTKSTQESIYLFMTDTKKSLSFGFGPKSVCVALNKLQAKFNKYAWEEKVFNKYERDIIYGDAPATKIYKMKPGSITGVTGTPILGNEIVMLQNLTAAQLDLNKKQYLTLAFKFLAAKLKSKIHHRHFAKRFRQLAMLSVRLQLKLKYIKIKASGEKKEEPKDKDDDDDSKAKLAEAYLLELQKWNSSIQEIKDNIETGKTQLTGFQNFEAAQKKQNAHIHARIDNIGKNCFTFVEKVQVLEPRVKDFKNDAIKLEKMLVELNATTKAKREELVTVIARSAIVKDQIDAAEKKMSDTNLRLTESKLIISGAKLDMIKMKAEFDHRLTQSKIMEEKYRKMKRKITNLADWIVKLMDGYDRDARLASMLLSDAEEAFAENMENMSEHYKTLHKKLLDTDMDINEGRRLIVSETLTILKTEADNFYRNRLAVWEDSIMREMEPRLANRLEYRTNLLVESLTDKVKILHSEIAQVRSERGILISELTKEKQRLIEQQAKSSNSRTFNVQKTVTLIAQNLEEAWNRHLANSVYLVHLESWKKKDYLSPIYKKPFDSRMSYEEWDWQRSRNGMLIKA
jgi:chromosome segregation ATPase